MEKVNRFIFWTPRILAIIFILFLALFSLDTFDSCNGFFDCALGLFMHNIPSLVLLVVLIISWKYEWVGGVVFILAGLLYIGFILKNIISTGFEGYYLSWAVQISGIAFLVGILFFVNWKQKKKTKRKLKHKRIYK